MTLNKTINFEHFYIHFISLAVPKKKIFKKYKKFRQFSKFELKPIRKQPIIDIFKCGEKQV